MKAGVYLDYRSFRVMERDKPEAAADQALVRLSHCGISALDVEAYSGKRSDVLPPRILGHEICGTVEQVHSPISEQNLVGKRVAINPLISCGSCRKCRSGLSNQCRNRKMVGLTLDGGFADYLAVPVSNLHRLPGQGGVECYTLAFSLARAMHAVVKLSLRGGESVLILGSRPVDLLCGLLLRKNKDCQVMVAGYNSFQLNIAWGLGLSCVNLNDTDFAAVIQGRCPGAVMVGSLCSPDHLGLAAELAQSRGQIIVIGAAQDGGNLPCLPLVEKELRISGSYMYDHEEFRKSVQDISEHLKEYSTLITHRLPIEDTLEGIKILETVAESMQIVITN